jgi:hypothetical protein
MKWNWPLNLYLINLGLPLTHKIASAYWEVCKLFDIPGGISVFLMIHFIPLLAALSGLVLLLRGEHSRNYFALVLEGTGLFAFCIHLVFILKGYPEFTLPVSIILLTLILVGSSCQGLTTVREMKRGDR